jgi:hypothetical protein
MVKKASGTSSTASAKSSNTLLSTPMSTCRLWSVSIIEAHDFITELAAFRIGQFVAALSDFLTVKGSGRLLFGR